MCLTKKHYFTLLVIIMAFILSACTSNDIIDSGSYNNYGVVVQAADFAFYGLTVGSSVDDLLSLLGEPNGMHDLSYYQEIDYIYSYSQADFMIRNGYIIGYYIRDTQADFRPLGVSIGNTLAEAIAFLAAANIPITEVVFIDGFAHPSIYYLLPGKAYVLLTPDEDIHRSAENINHRFHDATIMVISETISPILHITFMDGFVESFQVI